MKHLNDYYTIPEAAAKLKISASYVRVLVVRGRLPSRKLGKRLNLLPKSAVDTFIRRPMGQPRKIRQTNN